MSNEAGKVKRWEAIIDENEDGMEFPCLLASPDGNAVLHADYLTLLAEKEAWKRLAVAEMAYWAAHPVKSYKLVDEIDAAKAELKRLGVL